MTETINSLVSSSKRDLTSRFFFCVTMCVGKILINIQRNEKIIQ